jgi:hypothetical protein
MKNQSEKFFFFSFARTERNCFSFRRRLSQQNEKKRWEKNVWENVDCAFMIFEWCTLLEN